MKYLAKRDPIHSWDDVECLILQEQAFDEREKYKEGKYIIEKAKMTKENW